MLEGKALPHSRNAKENVEREMEIEQHWQAPQWERFRQESSQMLT